MADRKGKKDIFLRIFILLIGLSVAHFGLTLFLMAGRIWVPIPLMF